MNAPSFCNYEDIETYSDLLPDGLVRGMRQRHLVNQDNTERTCLAARKIKSNCDKISDGLGQLVCELERGASNFDKLSELSVAEADKCFAATISIRASAEKIRKSSEKRKALKAKRNLARHNKP